MEMYGLKVINNGAIDILMGIIATLASVAMCIHQVPIFYHVCKKKDIGGLLPYPYVLSLVNYFFWMAYAIPPTGTTIQFRNLCNSFYGCVGMAFATIYTYIFWNCCPLYRFQYFGFAMCLTFISPIFLLDRLDKILMEQRDTVLGPIVIVLGTMLYATPIFNIMYAVRMKRVDYLPIGVLKTCCINAIAWMLYACLPPKIDVCLLITHGFGTVFTIAQLGVAYEIQSFMTVSAAGKQTTQCCVNDDDKDDASTPLLNESKSEKYSDEVEATDCEESTIACINQAEIENKATSSPFPSGGASFFGSAMERELETQFNEYGLSAVMSYALASFSGFRAALYVENNMSKTISDLRSENSELQQLNDKLNESADKSDLKLKEFTEAIGKRSNEVRVKSKEFLEAVEIGNEVKVKLKEFLEVVGMEGDLDF